MRYVRRRRLCLWRWRHSLDRRDHGTHSVGWFGALSSAQLGFKRLDAALEARHHLSSRRRADERNQGQHDGQEESDDRGQQECESHSGYPSLPSASAVADSGHTGAGAAT